MAEEQTYSNVHDDLDDLLKEVADAHLPGYSKGTAQVDDSRLDTLGDEEGVPLTAAQKKRRKKKNKKKEAAALQAQQQTYEQQLAESKRRHMTPLKEKIGSSFYQDTDSSEDEGLPDYKFGGYHPMHVGEVLIERYMIIQKLGWGHFSTVWLAKDIKYNTYVALKIQRSASHYLVAAFDEVEILDQVASYWMKPEWLDALKKYYKNEPEKLQNVTGNDCHCVQLLNCFLHHGAHGKHFVMVFEILGVNLLEVIKRYNYKGVPLPLTRIMAKQCLMGLDYLHRVCNIIHTDLKPENVNLCLTEREVQEIASRGQLTTTKMFELPEDLKKISAGKVSEVLKIGQQPKHSDDQRGRRGEVQNDDETNQDKTAKRAAKKRRQKERKQAEKIRAMQQAKAEKEKEMAEAAAAKENDFRPKTARYKKGGATTLAKVNESGTRRGAESKRAGAENWNLSRLSDDQLRILNEKLDEYQECPRSMSEPKKRYVASPDLRPEALEEADEQQQAILLAQMRQIQETGETPQGYFTYNIASYQTNKQKLDRFIEYRKQFEKSQQVRIQQKISKEEENGGKAAAADNESEHELSEVLGIPYLKFDLLDPRQIQHKIEEERAKKRGPKLGEDLKLKICDLGNGCWTYHHFSTEIQTRQYRSPEVIIGAKYNQSADLWSFACMIFEMATGDFLFEPRKGEKYGKNDDHLAQMMELLGRMPKSLAFSGLRSRRYFNSAGNLRNISGLNFWPLTKVLQEKYKFNEKEAVAFTDFLIPMLHWDPDKRASAESMLNHPWLTMEANYNTRVSQEEREAHLKVQQKAREQGEPFDLDKAEAAIAYYHNAEMSKLTDSEGEYQPADDEMVSPAKKQPSTVGSNMDKLQSFFDNDFDDDSSGFFFSDEEDSKIIRAKNLKVQRDLAEGQNLNNSFGCYSPEDWEHLHVDKGPNPQFNQLKPQVVPVEAIVGGLNGQAKPKVQLPGQENPAATGGVSTQSQRTAVQKNNFM